ncbi:MAG: hypothetical protein KGI06_02030 [Candidatus Micrarchaeota archaeon]|nr:hypothetical protein [Candidatus Micrarchaeota archaeon]
MMKYIMVAVMMGFLLSQAAAAVVGTASIRAPAVILANNTGSLTNISVVVTNGNGSVRILGPADVAASTIQSAYTAAIYASNYTGHNFSNYNFTYTIEDAGDNVSGPSAGAAMALLAVSAFNNRQLRSDFTMTGTIASNGSIGEIGGVYDKVGAAKVASMRLVLVPKVPKNDPENELYLLVQTNYGIPLVQVANVSQAAHFAFNGSISGAANETSYNFYRNYNLQSVPNASINCTSSCNTTIFRKLLNATFNLTRGEINSLNSNSNFSNVSRQFGMVLNQSIALSRKGYLYTSADFAFLDYVNVFYFNGYPSSRGSALSLLNKINGSCSSLSPPPLTTRNYNYVINAELRQAWGNYTINQVLQSYNSSQIESDEILDELYLGAQANGWCTAASLVYNESAQQGTYVAPSEALRSIAYSRISRALPFGSSIYLATAQQAYAQSNYPLAILDADYAYSIATASSNSSLSTAQLDNLTMSIALNSTNGVWATEFAKEAQFYVAESQASSNSTTGKAYAVSGYSAALLAQQISNDTNTITSNLLVTQGPPQQGINESMISYINYSQELIYSLIIVVIILLMINTALIIMIMRKIRPERAQGARRRRTRARK